MDAVVRLKGGKKENFRKKVHSDSHNHKSTCNHAFAAT